MKCSARNFVKNALAKGYMVGVADYDDELWYPGSYRAVMKVIEGAHIARLWISDKEGEYLGWALCSLYDPNGIRWFSEPWETLVDYDRNAAMRELAEEG